MEHFRLSVLVQTPNSSALFPVAAGGSENATVHYLLSTKRQTDAAGDKIAERLEATVAIFFLPQSLAETAERCGYWTQTLDER